MQPIYAPCHIFSTKEVNTRLANTGSRQSKNKISTEVISYSSKSLHHLVPFSIANTFCSL